MQTADKGHADPDRIFANLGFSFVRRALWFILGACALTLSLALALGWLLEGDVTVHGAGHVEPTDRHVIKTAMAGRIEAINVRAGDDVAADDVLAVLSPRDIRSRLAQVEFQLKLSDARHARLEAQIQQDRHVLQAVLEARRLDVVRAMLVTTRIRREQQLYSEHAPKGWRRRQLDALVPVQEAGAALAQAEAQVEITQRQLAASQLRRQDLALERQTWQQLDAERRSLWQQLENTVIRAPVAGRVLTNDLDVRLGDRVEAGAVLLQLAAHGAWSAHVQIQQIDRPKIKTGQRVRVFVRAYPHLEFGVLEGRVGAVAVQSVNGSTFPVEVELDTTRMALADGMAAEARVAVDQGRLLMLVWKGLMQRLGSVAMPNLRNARG